MKKAWFMLAFLVLADLPLTAQDDDSLYAPEVATIDKLVAALYDVISGPAGEARDWDRMRYLFAPHARLSAVYRSGEGNVNYVTLTVDEYIERNGGYFEKNGFYEKELFRVTQEYDNLFHLMSTYLTLERPEGPVTRRGINSIQVARYDGRFWIVSIFWNPETPEHPIPEAYTPER